MTAPATRPPERPSASEIEQWIRDKLAALLEDEPARVNVHKPIAAYGVDSVEASLLAGELGDWLELELPADAIWEWSSAREIAERLAAHVAADSSA